jgi:hypothetical protein
MDHDHSYKLLFAHPKMVRDFLEAFAAAEWVSDADFSTLKRENGIYIADDLRERADDIIWSFRCGQDRVYVLLEFQSKSDRFMSVRVLTYVGLLYQDLIRRCGSRGIRTLPAILPIVLHSGEKHWSAAEDVGSLLSQAPRGLEPYRPQLRYLLIDEARYDEAELASQRNFAAMLFRLERCRQPELMKSLLGTLAEWLDGPDLDDLRRAFGAWLRAVAAARLKNDDAPTISNDLWEKPSMLAERMIEWEQQFMERGLQRGRQEGRQEGEARILACLLRKRFGELPGWVDAQLNRASLEQLESWGEQVLDAASLQDLLGSDTR